LLAPDEDDFGCRYTLYVEGAAQSHWAENLDRVLRKNPHYAHCRDLGQLLPLRVFVVSDRGFEIFTSRQTLNGIRLGDIKPALLSRIGGWSKIFPGGYFAAERKGEALTNCPAFSFARQPGI